MPLGSARAGGMVSSNGVLPALLWYGGTALLIKWGVQPTPTAEHPRCCNVCPRSSAYEYPYCPHGSRGPIWLCPSCDKSFRAYNSDVGYDSQIVTSGGGVTVMILTGLLYMYRYGIMRQSSKSLGTHGVCAKQFCTSIPVCPMGDLIP
eukprot:COSAG05_NODE_708_length_7825_cov_14.966865_1_plen_147_part_10